MKICPVAAKLFHAYGRTDRQTNGRTDAIKLKSHFSQFCIHTYKSFALSSLLSIIPIQLFPQSVTLDACYSYSYVFQKVAKHMESFVMNLCEMPYFREHKLDFLSHQVT
jgi:hypothetical protein